MVDFAKGMWLLPSRRRPHNLKRFFESIVAAGTTSPGIVMIQTGDWLDNEAAYRELVLPPRWIVHTTSGDSQGDKIREVTPLWQDLDWVGLLGDDETIVTPNWDQILVSHLDGMNLVSCNDDWVINTRDGRIAGCIVWSGDLLRTVGYIFPPGMHHILLDDIWEEVGRATGCWQTIREVTIKHHHFENGGAPRDETYIKAYAYGDTDNPIWHAWRGDKMPAVIDRIKARRGMPG